MSTFSLHTSNLQERLSAKLAAKLRATPLSNPFATEIVVVQSLGMRRWLQMEIARHNGICASITFPFPQKFINDLLEKIYPDESKHLRNFSREILEWRIFACCLRIAERVLESAGQDFADLGRYLVEAKDDPGKIWQLAARLAYLFDQYSAYRPEWLIHRGLTGGQQEIWQFLTENHPDHPAALRQRFLTEITHIPAGKLPERVSVFGLATLAPWYLQTLEALALRIPVELYILQPTPEFWADLETPREIERRRKRGLSPRPENIDWNPLLASWGKTGRDFFRLAMDSETLDENPDFDAPKSPGLLGELQRDLLDPERSPSRDLSSFATGHSSFQVHACPGPMREVEIFRDQLLALFEQIPDLEPRDVLVMTPDLDTYAPIIEAVFGSPEMAAIPYSLADRTRGGPDDPGAILLRLFDVATGRFTATEVIDLLELPLIRNRFEIAESDLEKIRAWVARTNIRWGLDGDHRKASGVPEFEQNSWRAGLDRLLLGFAMSGDDSPGLYEEIAPFELTENSEAVLLTHLLEFIDRLSNLRKTLERPANLADWSSNLRAIQHNFFTADSLNTSEGWLMKEAIQNLEKSAGFAGEKIPFEVLRLHLESALRPDETQLGYLNGGVTFCACRPMRSVPFRVVAMLGLNNGVFPRPSPVSSLDLMSSAPRLGDRSQREDDRYLFLEALLSARDVFYLSYHGRSNRDGSDLLPSVLITELLDYMSDHYNVANIATRHPLQAFAPDYFSSEKLFSYSEANLNAAKALVQPRSEVMAFVSAPLPDLVNNSQSVKPQEFISFFINPAKYFLARRVDLKLRKTDELETDSEPFLVGGLTKYVLKNDAVSSLASSKKINEIESLWKAEGVLPPGEIGGMEAQKIGRSASEFFTRISPWIAPDPEPAEIDLEISGVQLTGQLSTQLFYRPSRVKPKDQIEAFLTHIILNAAGVSVPTRLVMEDVSTIWDPIETAEARQMLEPLAALFRRGLTEPLPFFPRSAMAWIEKVREGKDGIGAARDEWFSGQDRNQNERGPKESEDAHFKLCFGHLENPFDDKFTELAETILGPLVDRRRDA